MRGCTRGWSGFWSDLFALVAVLLLFGPALAQTGPLSQGQGFMVKPMRMETMAPPGQAVEVPLEIRNIAGTAPFVVNLRLVELSETIDGSWRLIEPDAGEDTSGLLSSRLWTRLSTDSVTVGPTTPALVNARLNVPASARGVYFAGIVAETPPPENVKGVAVRVRFLVPLIVNIQGRPVRQHVVLHDLLMDYKNDPGTEPTTTAHLRIVNRGRTFSRVRGTLRIERENEGLWRPVTTVDIPERGIIPGVALELGGDLMRRLPSGTYRLKGELYVDGRRVAPLEKQIDFVGDPNTDFLAYDTTLALTPDLVDLDVAPGATRTTIMRVENPGDDPLNVKMISAIPRGLVGVEMGDLQGTDLSAAGWTEVRPAEFTIRPRGWQNVRVISRVPRDGVTHPHYYADLILSGTYADGQSAGETRSTVHLANREASSTPNGSIDLLSLAEGEGPSKYVVQMRFANTGDVHLKPVARALVLNSQGRMVGSAVLSGDEGSLLPLSKRTFSGDLNLEGIEPGYYALRAVVALAPGKEVSTQRVLRVEPGEPGADGSATTPSVTVLDPAAVELPAGVSLPVDDSSEGGTTNAQ